MESGSWKIKAEEVVESFSDFAHRGYHSILSSFGKVFHLENRWKLIREMGSGAYGVVISAEDEISGEAVAIKLVTRVFDKIQLAKRALREITLLRHFAGHENITGLIDVDAISLDFNEMCADLCLFYKALTLDKLHLYGAYGSGSTPNYQVRPEFDERARSIFSISGAESRCLVNRVHFSGAFTWTAVVQRQGFTTLQSYVDQLNKVLDVLGTPEEKVMKKIGSEKAQAYVRSLPVKKKIPFRKILPAADPQALDLLAKMLAFDPSDRITVPEALEHPWLASYHDESDEPECPQKFEKWRLIEELETLEDYRTALWNEIEDYRREVRGLKGNESTADEASGSSTEPQFSSEADEPEDMDDATAVPEANDGNLVSHSPAELDAKQGENQYPEPILRSRLSSSPEQSILRRGSTTTDPVVTYARRSSIMQSTSRRGSTYTSPLPTTHHLPTQVEGLVQTEPGSVTFPTQQGYVVPARSRTGSMAGGDMTRKLLRTLSTVSIHESVEGLEGGLAGIAPIGKYIVEGQTEADAPPSEMPCEFGIDEASRKGEGAVEMKKAKESPIQQRGMLH
ncbi:hypothetical protein H0H93_004012 [Arthromyces matolae]|nr:hypothetical protein H0H93_004012 [Arthromyces matolae]